MVAAKPAPHATLEGCKQEIREGHLRLVQCTSLWAQKTKVLNRDWAELTYLDDPTLQMLLAAGALKSGAGSYIGVNARSSIIRANERRFEEQAGLCRWHTGRMEPLLLDPDEPLMQNVGVLVFDAYETVANARIDGTLLPVLDFALRQKARLGQFVLSCTFSLRGTRATRSKDGTQYVLDLVANRIGVSVDREEHTVTYRSGPKSQPMLMFRVLL